MESDKQKCKLCDVKIYGTNFDLIEAVTKDVLDVLLPKMKFEDDMQYLMCNICSVKLNAALDFKSVCLHTNNTIMSYINFEESSPIDLKYIYIKEKGISTLDDEQICRLCMHPINGGYISVEKVHPSTTHMYIPEIDFRVSVDPIICKMCYNSLFTHSNFLKNCLTVEQRTQKHNNPIMDTNLSDSYIKVEDIEIKHEMDNEENQYKEDCQIMDTDLKASYIKTEEIEIKNEEENEEDQEKSCETQLNEIQLKEEIKQESDPSLHFLDHGTNLDHFGHLQPTKKAYEMHTYEIKIKENNDIVKHQKHKDPAENQIYNCSQCEYETKYKSYLGKHQLRHKHPSEVKMYKCSECKYETRLKRNLSRHQLRHEDPLVQMYKCSQCKYETKIKRNLIRHQLKHTMQMYKCSECKYESKIKRDLIRHQLKHMDPSEMQMYKCSECKFETRYKSALVRHQLIHKDPSQVEMYKSEVQMFKCSECKYETRYKNALLQHLLTHKHPSEVEMYKCSECKYETKYKNALEIHQLRHKDPSEVQMHRCRC